MPKRCSVLFVALAACPGAFHFDADAGCTAGGSCPGPLHCSSTLGRCVECLGEGDCSGAYARCEVGQGRCVECLSSGDCDAGAVCDSTETYRCVPTCVTDAGCSRGRCAALPIGMVCDSCYLEDICERVVATPHCDPGRRVCVRCYQDLDCAEPTPKCDRLSGTCRQCIDARQCSPNAWCSSDGTCVAQ